jgi:purine-binding chemotaxis protein CheW
MNSASSDIAVEAPATGTRQLLTFHLVEESYGVDILRVREIRGWTPVTRIPSSAAHVLGVLNLRGSIVPAVDLRVLFRLPPAECNGTTVIVVLSISTPSGWREVGLVVDSVSDVVTVNESDIQPAPQLAAGQESDFLLGLVPVGQRMAVLLDLDRLMGAQPGRAQHTTAASSTQAA